MEEIRRLSILIEEFERPFHPDPHILNVYKKVKYLGYILASLCVKLHGRVIDWFVSRQFFFYLYIFQADLLLDFC